MKFARTLLYICLPLLLVAFLLPPRTLTKDERTQVVKLLETGENSLKKATKGLSEAQANFKPAPDKWSIKETVEHIAVSEALVRQAIIGLMKGPADSTKMAEVKGKDQLVLNGVPDRSHKVKTMEMLEPKGRFATLEDAVKAFDASRDSTIQYVRETSDELRLHFYTHPALGLMDGYQWMLFEGAHTQRHLKQIEEVKADAAFPKK